MNKIVTHSQEFHADDVFACAVARILHPDIEVVRTRDRELIESLSADPLTFAVVDVGSVYDHDRRRYDHHQADFVSPGNHWVSADVPCDYASFGLVWFHHAVDAIRAIAPDLSEESIENIQWKIHNSHVWSVDVWDYGHRPDRETPWTTISAVISSFRSFDHALEFATDFLRRAIAREVEHYKSLEIVTKVIEEALEADPSCRIFEFSAPMPWNDVTAVRELRSRNEDLIAYYPVASDSWQVLPARGLYLPRDWRAKNMEELDRATGLTDTVFCHKSGFIGGTKDRESALRMAEEALRVGLDVR